MLESDAADPVPSADLSRMMTAALAASPTPAFDNYVALGTHCYTAWLLKKMGVRGGSGPFDWLFSSPEMIAHCLEDDFGRFLDSRYFSPIPLEDRRSKYKGRRCHHDFYMSEFGVRNVFNHHDPTFADDYDRYIRRVQRFRASLGQKNLFLMISNLKISPALARLNEIIQIISPRSKLLAVEVQKSPLYDAAPQFSAIDEQSHAAFMVMYPTSALTGLNFGSLADERALAGEIACFVAASSARYVG